MIARPDILVSSPTGEIQLVVEVKNKQGASDEWAAQLRRNLLAHAAVPHANFFLLALGDNLHLWRGDQELDETPADYTVPTAEALGPYLEGWEGERLTEGSFALLVTSWLSGLIHSDISRETAPPELSWIFDSGLYDGIRHGHIEREAVA